jgi:hypothetical protein
LPDEIYELKIKNALKASRAGVLSGCPMCCSRVISDAPAGSRIRFFGGLYAGHYATVIEFNPDQGRTIIQLDDYPNHGQNISSGDRDPFLFSPVFEPPEWHPWVSMQDFEQLERIIINAIVSSNSDDVIDDTDLINVIGVCWGRRLPTSADDILKVFVAHGFSSEKITLISEKLRFGMRQQIVLNGRPPNGRKRLKPFSAGRYLTKNQKEMRMNCGLPFA